ncbi:TAB2 homolog, chloroplastic-like protein [Drosera capensis]
MMLVMMLSYFDPEVDPESITEWELDFSARPILDVRGKKIWELVVCDSSLSLQYFPNIVINSITLKEAIASVSDRLGVPLPEKIRYFRSQMQTIITKACKELSIKPIPRKRKGSKPFLALDYPFPKALPENLFGDRWAFVQLPYSAVREEISSFNEKFAFGASLDLDLLGLEIDDNTLIPGLAVESSRAMPLAGIPSRRDMRIT